ncbi:MAG: hypothetical protein IJQ82_11070 [Selenomonadaceae bacterium]|nr:hypothetical protein [Selenomonadaceae bacterium]
MAGNLADNPLIILLVVTLHYPITNGGYQVTRNFQGVLKIGTACLGE